MSERARFLVNPGGGRGRTGARLEVVRRLAERIGATLAVSTSVGDLTLHARRAAEDGVERLIVAGGDGTLHHAVQGLAHSETALAVLPMGSGNDLAGSLGVPSDAAAAVESALSSPIRGIDLGRAGGRWFAGVAGVGFDSEVNRFANERVRFVKGTLIYPYATLRMIGPFVAPQMRIEHDGGIFDGGAMFAVIANSHRYGGGMLIAPGADLSDGLLDLVIVRAISKLELLLVFPKVFKGGHVDHPAVSLVRTRKVAISLSRPITAYGDGEPLVEVSREPVLFEVVPGALKVVAPGVSGGAPA